MTVMGGKRTIPRKGINRMGKKMKQRIKNLKNILPPADNKCELCGQEPDWRGLQKHHKIFRSHNGTDDNNNIEFLCGKCHSLRHGIHEV